MKKDKISPKWKINPEWEVVDARQKLATEIAASMGLPTKGVTWDFAPNPLRYDFKKGKVVKS